MLTMLTREQVGGLQETQLELSTTVVQADDVSSEKGKGTKCRWMGNVRR